MRAATNRRETGVRVGNASPLRARVSRPVFRAAYKQLCTRIWIELEFLAQAAARVDRRPSQDLVMSSEILRLELVVLVDSCRSPYWRCMLSAEQCDSMCSTLTDVLAALHVDSEHLPTGIAEAQGRVLDELLPEPEAAASLGDPESVRELGAGSEPALKELLSLIEAQAAAHAIASAETG